jgi:phosphoglycolate phosphatase
MARQQFDLIVFDWDGTLMDSTAHITRSIQAACRDLSLPVPADEAASYVSKPNSSTACAACCRTCATRVICSQSQRAKAAWA